MNKRVIFLGSVGVGVLLLALILYQSNIPAILAIVQRFSLKLLLLYVGVSLGILSLLVLRWQLILRAEGHEISFVTLFLYRLSGFSVSYLMPTMHVGGSPFRAIILQKQHVPIEKGACSVILDESLEFSADVLIAATGFFIILTQFTVPTSALILMVFVILLALMILVRFFYLNFRGTGSFSSAIRLFNLDAFALVRRLKQKIKRIEFHIIDFLKNHREEFFISSVISMGLWFLMFVEYDLALRIVGYAPEIQEIFLVLTFVALAYLIPIPAALGVLEAAQISVFTLLGVDLSIAIALSLLIRARDLLWTIFGLAYASHEGFSMVQVQDDTKRNNL